MRVIKSCSSPMGGQLIRTPVDDIRIAGRNTQGVTIFKTRDGDRVVSVGRIEDVDDDDEASDDTGEDAGEE